MAWWNFLTGGVAELVKAGTGVVTAVAGDQAAKDEQLSTEQIALLNAYGAEFVARQQRNRFDSFADGINRLIRPALAIGAQGMLVWAAVDPVSFVETMRVLAVVPEPLWYIWMGVWAFYFTGRILENAPKKWKIEPRALEIAKEIAQGRAARRAAEQPQPQPPALPAPAPALDRQSPTDSSASDDVYAGRVDNGTDPLRAMAATIWGEARGEPFEGKVAVAWVIVNRSRMPGWWGKDIRSVCTTRWQFSCWFDAQAEQVRFIDERNEKFAACLDAAKRVMAGDIADPTGGADHYYADYIAAPKWAHGRTPTTKIGRHLFFRLGLGG